MIGASVALPPGHDEAARAHGLLESRVRVAQKRRGKP